MKKKSFYLFMLFSIAILFSSCQDKEEEIDCNDLEWGYESEIFPDKWGTCFDNCGGKAQSPINITGAKTDNSLPSIETNYDDVAIDVLNNGHTIEFEYHEGSSINYGGKEYKLLQFHFHTFSEHKIENRYYPMEVHLVHQHEESGALAVIGIMFKEGQENPFLANFTSNLPANKGERYISSDSVNVENLLPTNRDYYTYTGSLTTPPCSEIVTWLVLKSNIEASTTQIKNIENIVGENFRPIKALNGRSIKSSN